MFTYLWSRFLWLGWIGKAVVVIAILFAAGWILGKLGLDSAARSLGGAGIFVLSLLLAGLFIRLLWQNGTARHRQ
ncbi:MAG TPA: hypothetical protein VF081_09270 [Solirubrobacterales bacterium]